MLSIITCSRRKTLNESFVKNIGETIGVEYELITIDNSANDYSIFSAYNRGIALSKFENLCFIHDDIEIKTQNWGQIIMVHLQIPNVGLLGVAGGNLKSRVPNDWALLDPSVGMIYGMTGESNDERILYPRNYQQTTKPSLILDGVFLCSKKQLFNQIAFDETLGGFHAYDYDISLQAHNKGYENFVIYDVLIEHASNGVMGYQYYSSHYKLQQKWSKHLPIYNRVCDQKQVNSSLPELELKAFKMFFKRICRTKTPIAEIRAMTKFYSKEASIKTHLSNDYLIYFAITFQRVFSQLRGKMIE
jgi:Glycosyltransferase like family